MPIYRYEGLDVEGKDVSGTIDAPDEISASERIRTELKHFVTKIREVSGSGGRSSTPAGGGGSSPPPSPTPAGGGGLPPSPPPPPAPPGAEPPEPSDDFEDPLDDPALRDVLKAVRKRKSGGGGGGGDGGGDTAEEKGVGYVLDRIAEDIKRLVDLTAGKSVARPGDDDDDAGHDYMSPEERLEAERAAGDIGFFGKAEKKLKFAAKGIKTNFREVFGGKDKKGKPVKGLIRRGMDYGRGLGRRLAGAEDDTASLTRTAGMRVAGVEGEAGAAGTAGAAGVEGAAGAAGAGVGAGVEGAAGAVAGVEASGGALAGVLGVLGGAVGAAVGGLVALGVGVYKAVNAVLDWSDAAFASAKHLSEVSGSMAGVFAQREVHQLQRDIAKGEATAGTMGALEGSEDDLKNALQPIQIILENIWNTVLSKLIDILVPIIQKVADVLITLYNYIQVIWNQEAEKWNNRKWLPGHMPTLPPYMAGGEVGVVIPGFTVPIAPPGGLMGMAIDAARAGGGRMAAPAPFGGGMGFGPPLP